MKLTKGRRDLRGCGHRGFGKYCHRCDAASSYEKELEVLNKSKNISDDDKKRRELLQKEIPRLREPSSKSKVMSAAQMIAASS